MKKQSDLHAGHRARLRERFLNNPEGLAEHELLELLLFYAIPRQDTNDLAHTLIEAFGSLSAVLEADVLQLTHVAGIGNATAAFLKAIGAAARHYVNRKLTENQNIPVFDTPSKIAKFLWPRFLGQTTERVYALLLDNGMHLLDCYHVCDGSLVSAPISVRRIVERAYAKGAVAVVLAHNHPGGMAVPSGDDVRMTRTLDTALRMMEVPLIEHYVFSDRSFAPIMSRIRAGGEKEYAATSLFDLMHERLDAAKSLMEDSYE